MRVLVVSLAVLGAVLAAATHALALNPQPLPPGMRTHLETAQMLPAGRPIHAPPRHIVPRPCKPGVHCLF